MIKLNILIATANPLMFKHNYLRTMDKLKPLFDYCDVTHCVMYGRAYKNNEVIESNNRIEEFTKVKAFVGTVDRTNPVYNLQTLSLLDQKCDCYLIAIDNFSFLETFYRSDASSGVRYRQAINYLTYDDKCGGVMCSGFIGGDTIGYKIRGIKDQIWRTDKGLFLRNYGYGLTKYPRNGVMHETVMAYCRIEDGYYMAKLMNCPISRPTEQTYSYDAGALTTKDNVDFIRDHYSDADWMLSSKKMPLALIASYYKNEGLNLDNLPLFDYADI